VEIGCANNSPGLGFQSEFLSLSNLVPGTYYIRIVNENGTAGMRANVCVNVTSVGISEIKNDRMFIISPNPFSSGTTLTFEKEMVNGILAITDVLGKQIKTINFSGNELIVEKGEMKPGIYFAQITDEKKNILTKKIIIQ
jgi:hypothetical protein